MFKRTSICYAVLAALGATSLPALAQSTERVEVTGSRIKRVDAEGSLPITSIGRAELQASGAATVAEFVRLLPFASAGNFRPRSGSSAQSFADINLRALSSARTLVLIDGRRAAKGPMVGDSVDLNIIPMAMIERVEVLTDGASAIYGSDAIAGVVNFITRKDFEGIELMVGGHSPAVTGGDRKEASVLIGATSKKARVVAGASATEREIIFSRERPWQLARGASVFGNNYTTFDANGNDRFNFTAIPNGCNDPNFYLTGTAPNQVCRYDFTAVAADEAALKSQSVFARGDYQITDNWNGYLGASISRVKSFGRYAPTPGEVSLPIGSPSNPLQNVEPVTLYHRFAAAGNRDTFTDNNYYNLSGGVRGRLFDMLDVDVGFRRSDSQYYELGRNYIVRPLAEQAIQSGTYNIFNPSGNPQSVLQSISATINRDARFTDTEFYATGNFELFSLPGGKAQGVVGLEQRKELFFDRYDSLQESGVILGSAGNSSGGSRDVRAGYLEVGLPVLKNLEANVSARYESYSDYGSDFSPKLSLRFKPFDRLAVRASAGTGFRAPSLPILTQKTTFSAESVVDAQSCAVLNPGGADCQVNTFTIANPALDSEKSKQFSVGLVFDATDFLSIKLDYYNLKIEDVIRQIDAQDLVDRNNGTDPRPTPAGLGVVRNTQGVISRINSGYANEGTIETDGIDLTVTTNFNLGSMGRLTNELRWSHVLKWVEGGFDFNGAFEQPQDRATLMTRWAKGDFAVTWNVNYIGKNERQPNSNDSRANPAYTTHDLQLSWNTPIKGGTLTLGMVNAADKEPPLRRAANGNVDRAFCDGREFCFDLYDAYGRTTYFRYTQRF
jgi:iron complex outermembrane recepter protein